MIKRMTFYICILILTLPYSGPALSSQAKTIVTQKAGECILSVESDDAWGTLRLRAHHPEYKNCRVGKEEMVAILREAFSKAGAPKLEGNYTSLFIGRLVDYPWLSHYLALAALNDSGWDAKKSRPVVEGINKYVSDLLSIRDLTSQLEAPFTLAGYKITGAMVEKVLLGTVRDLPFFEGDPFTGVIPYDAMVWFKLERI